MRGEHRELHLRGQGATEARRRRDHGLRHTPWSAASRRQPAGTCPERRGAPDLHGRRRRPPTASRRDAYRAPRSPPEQADRPARADRGAAVRRSRRAGALVSARGPAATAHAGAAARPRAAADAQPASCPDVQVVAVPGTWESSRDDDPYNPTAKPASLMLNVTRPLQEQFRRQPRRRLHGSVRRAVLEPDRDPAGRAAVVQQQPRDGHDRRDRRSRRRCTRSAR